MSTTALPQAMTPPADRGWIPSPLYRMTVEQYEAHGGLALLQERPVRS